MKIGDIEFEIESQEDQIQAPSTEFSPTVTELSKIQLLSTAERPPSPRQSRNVQRRNPKTMGRKLVQQPKASAEVHSETGSKRIPL